MVKRIPLSIEVDINSTQAQTEKDTLVARLRSSQTNNEVLSAFSAALLLPLTISLTAFNLPNSNIKDQLLTDNTNTSSQVDYVVTDIEIIDLLNNIQARLINNQIDIDERSKDILYDNLWDLYI